MDLYCVKCKTRTSTNDVTTITTKNNRSALTGKCATCGIQKFRFISMKSDVFKKKNNTEVTSPQNLQNSPEPHGKNTPEKSIFQNIATGAPEHD